MSRRLHGAGTLVLALAAWATPGPAAAQVEPTGAAATALPVQIGLGAESMRLPGGERLGLVAGQLLFQVAEHWWLGPVAYGAASGRRGGFFVGGLEVQHRWPLGHGLTLASGLSLGGGGGAGAPVGDGLLLRPSLALTRAWGPLQAGLSLSEVRFPGTDIRSRQAGLVLGWQGRFAHLPLARVGQRVHAPGRSGLGVDQLALTLAQHRPDAGSGTRPFQLVGVRLDRRIGAGAGPLSWGLEAAAAAQGSAAGYMEILVHAGREWRALPGLALGLRAAAGLGGGGAVPTGGGGLLRLDGSLAATIHPGWQLGASWGRSHGHTTAMRAQRRGLWLATDLEPAGAPASPGRAGAVVRTTWGGGLLHIAPMHRRSGGRRSLDAVSLVLERWVGPHAYLAGQAHSALAGAAGGYSIGLVGGGMATAAGGGWQAGAELLAGGAGGGGVDGATGFLLLGQAWASHPLGDPAQRLRLGLGVLRGSGGGPARPLLSLTWSTTFGQAGR